MSGECHSKKGENFVILAIIFLTVFIVVAVTYSAYLFIDVTHITSVAGVHVTKTLSMAASSAQGKLYSDPKNGIADWLVYTDKSHGFEIKYPNDLILQKGSKGSEHLIVVKESNDSSGNGASSLSAAIYVDVKDSPDSMSIREEVKKMGIAWDENWKQEQFGGRPGIRTGEIKDSSGAVRDMVIWQFGGKIFSLEEDCFSANSQETQDIFNKIVSEFKFI